MGDWFVAIIKEFEATHPGVKIEFNKVGRLPADTMTTLFAAGRCPISYICLHSTIQFAAGWF